MDARFLQGDTRAVTASLPAESIQCCVTSPPYYGLRDYGVTGQIGLEATPDAYVAEMVEVFRGVRRVLRPDGVLWLNLGDSYANDGKWGGSSGGKHVAALHGNSGIGRGKRTTGLKPKDLIGIPWRVAFALQADGWWLRSAIVWHKPNPMPEQVKDRPTSAYEQVFLLSKSARYFYDADAIAEPAVSDHGSGNGFKRPANGSDVGWSNVGGTRNARNVWTITPKPFKGAHFATMPVELAERCILAGSRVGDTILDPFGGAGTTGLAALRHGRRATLVELNPAYIAIAENRLREAMAPLVKRAA